MNRRKGDPRYTRYISWLHWHYMQGRDVSKLNYEEYERRARVRKKNQENHLKQKRKAAGEWILD